MSLGLAIVGAGGRMGQRLCALADESPDLQVIAPVDQGDDLDGVLTSLRPGCGIDFSVQSQTQASLASFQAAGVPLVIGTTGLKDEDHRAMEDAAVHIPVLWAPNFSVGVNALVALVAKAAKALDEGWDLELIEAHHRHKVDAPSGTAVRLLEVLAAARAGSVTRCGREGLVGPRPAEEIDAAEAAVAAAAGDRSG